MLPLSHLRHRVVKGLSGDLWVVRRPVTLTPPPGLSGAGRGRGSCTAVERGAAEALSRHGAGHCGAPWSATWSLSVLQAGVAVAVAVEVVDVRAHDRNLPDEVRSVP